MKWSGKPKERVSRITADPELRGDYPEREREREKLTFNTGTLRSGHPLCHPLLICVGQEFSNNSEGRYTVIPGQR